MTHREATRLSTAIERDDPACRVTGFRRRMGSTNGRQWVEEAVEVVDTRTGYPFLVCDAADWEDRKAEAEAPII